VLSKKLLSWRKKYSEETWEDIARELQSENVELDPTTKHAEEVSELSSKKEKRNSIENWENAEEREDVLLEIVKLVQDVFAQEEEKEKVAEEDLLKNTKKFTLRELKKLLKKLTRLELAKRNWSSKLKKKRIEVRKDIKKLKQLPVDVLKGFCKRRAITKCGEGKDHQECRRRVRQEIQNKETIFRVSAIQSCKCETTADKFSGKSCGTIVKSCTKSCIRNACKLRSTLECKTKDNQTTCTTNHYSRCSKLHLKNDN